MRSVPGGLRRLLRDRGRLVAVVLLATVALSASGIQSAAAVALHRTLDANWRGAYDVLVTAQGTVPGAAGLIAPNALSSADKRMSLADVAKIRTVAGIDVAAPIGEVVLSGLALGNPTIALPPGVVDASTVPQAFQVTTTYSTDDGLGPRYVTSKTSNVVIDESPRPPVPPPTSCNLNGFDVDIVKYPLLCTGFGFGQRPDIVTVQEGSGWGSGETVSDGIIHFQTYDAPQGSTRITLVDPVAERELLGADANFLRPLISLAPSAKTSTAQMTTWANGSVTPYAKDFLDYQEALDSSFSSYADAESTKQFRAFERDHGVDPDKEMGPPPVYVPLLTANAGAAALTVSTTVRTLGPAPRTASPQASFPYELPPASASPTTSLGTTTVDGSALLNPFALAPVDVDWPGTHSPRIAINPIFTSLQFLSPGTVAGAQYAVGKAPDGSIHASLTASGYGQPIPPQGTEVINPYTLVEDGTAPGLESVYSPVTLLPQPRNGGTGVGVPIGSFSTRQLEGLQSSLSYVPLGAYQPIGSTVKAGGKTATLKPSVTGLGIESPRTIAIASINSAPAWHQATPVTAVRVRVAGISSYSLQAQQKVVSVAQAIQKLGFTATIVAGSSPTAVTVTVKKYAFGVAEAGGEQRVGTLGNITQDWSELGAAARADVAVSASSLSVLGIALGSTALLLGAVQFASVPGRRGQATVLRELGWTRRRIRRWMAEEEIPGIVVVLLAGVSAALLSGFAQVSVLIATLGFAAVVVTSAVAIGLGSRARQKALIRPQRIASGKRALRLRGRTPATFGLRQARINLTTSITQIVAVIIVAISGAGLAEVFFEGRRRAGASLLAQFTTGQAALFQLILAAVALGAGILLAVLARRIDLARRSAQWTTMRAMGWTTADLRRAQRSESLSVALPAVLIAIAATWAGAHAIETPALLSLVAVGATAAILAALALLLVRRKAISQ